MNKFILLLLCAILVLLEPVAVQAKPASSADVTTETLDYPRVPRPVYKKYRGNSRRKHRKPGILRRMKLRREARRKQAANYKGKSKGVIKVDAPVGTMPKPQN